MSSDSNLHLGQLAASFDRDKCRLYDGNLGSGSVTASHSEEILVAASQRFRSDESEQNFRNYAETEVGMLFAWVVIGGLAEVQSSTASVGITHEE